jgi:hypothetical protein
MNDNEARLFTLLRGRYRAPEWCLLSQVRNSTGYVKARTRTADAIAMNTYPSRGLAVLGFELKVSRADWLRELKNAGKADDIALMCDYWWVVAEKGIVAHGELPHGWGLLEPHGRGLRAEVEAACVCDTGVLRERLMDRAFVAAILRRVTEADEAALKAAETRGRTHGFEVGQKHGRMADSGSSKLAELQSAVAAFTRASGVEIRTWEARDIGKAVKAVLSLQSRGYGGVLGALSHIREDLTQEAEHIGELERELTEATS